MNARFRILSPWCQQNRPGEWVFQDPKAISSLMCLWRNRAEVQRLFWLVAQEGHARCAR